LKAALNARDAETPRAVCLRDDREGADDHGWLQFREFALSRGESILKQQQGLPIFVWRLQPSVAW
jgi:hypothetical protein